MKNYHQIAKVKYSAYKLLCIWALLSLNANAQNIDFENVLQGSPLKVSGAINANSVYFNSNQNTGGRAPFTYFVQGALTASVYQFSMPISYSFSNQGNEFTSQVPFDFNRISIHPKYKWIQAHIGDTNMSFSPYTLNGFQFTGGGVELTPKGGFTFGAMGGRLLKATEDDGQDDTIPAFQRMGYGANFGYSHEDFTINLVGFYAKDDINSITFVPEEKGILPKENLVLSALGSYKIAKNFKLRAEYANTAITKDLRAETINETEGLASFLFDNRNSTEYYNAFNVGLDYTFDKYVVGVGYERIDPGYETLGAYFFNNDFENITLNMSTNFFKGKINVALNVGYQRDDLNNQKEQATSRTVGSVNTSYNVSERLIISGSYSNFTTFTNARVDQFEIINDDSLLDNDPEALNFRQLSQNANVNINYILAKKEKLQQTVNFNYALADVFNEQGGVVRIGDASTFHNFNTTHTLGLLKKNLNITTAFNATLNTVANENATTFGPTLGLSKRFFENKLNTGLSASYNNSNSSSGVTQVSNFRANASYRYKEKHNLNLNAIQLFRSAVNNQKSNDLTITFGYNYTFNIGAPKFNKRTPNNPKINGPVTKADTERNREKNKEESTRTRREKESKEHLEGQLSERQKRNKERIFSFSYHKNTFEGTHEEVTSQILELTELNEFDDLHFESVEDNLALLEQNMKANEINSDNAYKKAALDYLHYLYKHKNFIDKYHKLVFKSTKKLYEDASQLSYAIERQYLDLLVIITEKQNNKDYVSEEDLAMLKTREKKKEAHDKMIATLQYLSEDDVLNDVGVLKEFKDKYISQIFLMEGNGKSDEEIEQYLYIKLADLYHKDSNSNTK